MNHQRGIIVITQVGSEIVKTELWGYDAEDYIEELKPAEQRLSRFAREVIRKVKLHT